MAPSGPRSLGGRSLHGPQVPDPGSPRRRVRAPGPATRCPGGVGRGAGRRGAGCAGIPERARPVGTRLPAAGRRGAEGRGGARAALFPRAPLPARPVERSASPPASMQPRLQALPAPGPGGPRPAAPLLALLLLLLLAVRGSAAAPAGSEGPRDAGWQRDAELPHGLLQQAARAALHFFNFRAGSPAALRVLAAVQRGRAWVSAGATRRAGARARGPATHRVGGDAEGRAPVRLAAGRRPRLGWCLGAPEVSRRARRASVGAQSPRETAFARPFIVHRASPIPGRGVWGNGGTDPQGKAWSCLGVPSVGVATAGGTPSGSSGSPGRDFQILSQYSRLAADRRAGPLWATTQGLQDVVGVDTSSWVGTSVTRASA